MNIYIDISRVAMFTCDEVFVCIGQWTVFFRKQIPVILAFPNIGHVIIIMLHDNNMLYYVT